MAGSCSGGSGHERDADGGAGRWRETRVYVLELGGWRDYVTLLHVPYTAWHLWYVAIGAGVAPRSTAAGSAQASPRSCSRSGSAHTRSTSCTAGRWGPRSPTASSSGSPWYRSAVPPRSGSPLRSRSRSGSSPSSRRSFLVAAYNLELASGRFHTDLWFGLAWGAFPVLTAYFAMAGRLRGEAIVVAAFATLLSLARAAAPVDPGGSPGSAAKRPCARGLRRARGRTRGGASPARACERHARLRAAAHAPTMSE